MNKNRSLPRLWTAGILIIFAALIAGCVPIRLEARWPSLSTVGDEQYILMAYHDRLVMVDPTDGSLVRLRNADGEVRLDEQGNPRLWEVTGIEGQQPNQFYSSPVQVDANTLLAATYHNLIFEIDLPTARVNNPSGTQIPGAVLADPVLIDDLLYLGLSENDLLALDSESLAEVWRIPSDRGVWSRPLVIDGRMYFTSLDHHLYAVDVETGEELWQLDLGGAIVSTPAYYDGHLYVGSFARKIFDVSTEGEILAEYDTSDWVWASPTVVDDVLYAADLSGAVYALDVRDGGFVERWQSRVAENAISGQPLVADEYVVVGSRDQRVYWVSRNSGEIFFSRDLAGEVFSDMLLIEPGASVDIVEPYVIVSTVANQELLVAFTLEDGERMWDYGR